MQWLFVFHWPFRDIHWQKADNTIWLISSHRFILLRLSFHYRLNNEPAKQFLLQNIFANSFFERYISNAVSFCIHVCIRILCRCIEIALNIISGRFRWKKHSKWPKIDHSFPFDIHIKNIAHFSTANFCHNI